MRRGLAAILLCALALTLTAGFTARRELPPCCKAHGCAMMKRVTHGCALSRCDRNDTVVDEKPVPAVLTAESTLIHGRWAIHLAVVSVAAPPAIFAEPLDHPPQLLGA